MRGTRVNIILNPEMIREETGFTGGVEYEYPHFQGGVIDNLEATDEEIEYEIYVGRIQDFNQRGSNWRFNTVDSLDIHFGEYRPLRGSSYIELPPFIAAKKAVINLKKKDQESFKWCVWRFFHLHEDHPERISTKIKEQSEKFNSSGISFPVELSDISRFEKQNTDIAVNFLGFIHSE